jgi:hypothetical protein
MLDLYKNFWQNIKISSQEIITKEQEKNRIFQNYRKSPFLSLILSKKIEKIIKNSQIRDYVVSLFIENQGNVYFHFISNLSKQKIQKLIRYYFFVIYLRIQLPSNPPMRFNSNLAIYIFPIAESKKFVKNIGIHEMNSGSTHIHSDYYDGNIYVWRKDDIEKVLIHEALHSVHYDIDIINQSVIPELRALEKDGFNKLNINEAYTELCAIYLYNILKLSPTASNRLNKKILRNHLLKDLEHSLQNCAKLLKANNINSIEDLYLQNYKQDAAAFSYIILRTGLLWSLLTKCKSKTKKHVDQSLISQSHNKLAKRIYTEQSFIPQSHNKLAKRIYTEQSFIPQSEIKDCSHNKLAKRIYTEQSFIPQSEIKDCSHNKLAKRIYTDRLECLDDFLKIGWVGRIGIYYQYILLDIIKNKAFAREIMKHMDHLKNSVIKRKKMILAI